jgi:hypothetical protein
MFWYEIKFQAAICFRVMTTSIFFLNGNPPYFLDSNSPFNCLNDSIKILLVYIRKFLRKKNKKRQVKNGVTKYLLQIMELNVRIAIPQLVENKQVYEEIPPVLV